MMMMKTTTVVVMVQKSNFIRGPSFKGYHISGWPTFTFESLRDHSLIKDPFSALCLSLLRKELIPILYVIYSFPRNLQILC